jgi:colanic acid biosynthesis protein WcaH
MIERYSMEISGSLTDEQFLGMIKNAPLVSIDIIVKNKRGDILLGLRNNEPAKDTWFVPGGRIRKGEDLDVAFRRITMDELGLDFHREHARFIGVFENKYDTNFLNVPDIGTHYIVLAYEIKLVRIPKKLPDSQHQKYRWFSKSEARENPLVHSFVQPYFEE